MPTRSLPFAFRRRKSGFFDLPKRGKKQHGRNDLNRKDRGAHQCSGQSTGVVLMFALGTFSIAGCAPFAGLVRADKVIALHALNAASEQTGMYLSGADSMQTLLENWPRNFAALEHLEALFQGDALSRLQEQFVPVSQLRVHAPNPTPRQIFCTGANYRQHVLDLAFDTDESAPDMSAEQRMAISRQKIDERAATGIPYAFIKLPSAITGPYDAVFLPEGIEKPDWELELAVVIGRRTRYVSRQEAMQCIAGYTIGNDISARDRLYRKDLRTIGTDWMSCKSPPSFLPMGPYLVPAAFVPDPGHLRLKLDLNGQTMQDASTEDMIFDIARQIEYLSQRIELWPGDIVMTGSPAGNGTHHKRFLRAGDQITGSIQGLGELRNECVDEQTGTK